MFLVSSAEKRKIEAEKIRSKYPDRVPVSLWAGSDAGSVSLISSTAIILYFRLLLSARKEVVYPTSTSESTYSTFLSRPRLRETCVLVVNSRYVILIQVLSARGFVSGSVHVSHSQEDETYPGTSYFLLHSKFNSSVRYVEAAKVR